MGSRLAVSRESTLHEAVKSAVVAKREGDTIYSKNIDGLYARVMKTPAAAKAAKKVSIYFPFYLTHRGFED
jgi:enoyl-[acyl-carrier protein] reductase II